VLVRDEKQLISTRLANSSRAAPQKKLHHDQLNRSTGLSTVLIVMQYQQKASLSGDENDYVMAYKPAHARFPHETTLEQLFTEEQFECYRALGEHIARRFLSGEDLASPTASGRTALVTLLKNKFPSVSVA
jgi:hypothetical protein